MHHLSCTCAPGCRQRKTRAEFYQQELKEIREYLDTRGGILHRTESRLMKSIREQEARR